MLKLTEERAKAWLAQRGLPVPRGCVVTNTGEAARAMADFPMGAMLKALVPTGRRGLAGAVRAVDSADDCGALIASMVGTTVSGCKVERVYVEERVAIDRELYLSFSLAGPQPALVLSQRGGVDIEETARSHPEAIVRASVDPLQGLPVWRATRFWAEAGVRGVQLPVVASLTTALYDAFRAADAELLEINPLAVDGCGKLWIVGAMLGIDDAALFRHPQWQDARREALPASPRERAVALADLDFPGGECRYVELDGDIGLLVGGGGAGLYQHDLVIELGGRPANHSVTPPTGSDNRKMKAVIGAILDNPRLRALLIGFNFAQMARADIRVRSLAEVLDARGEAMRDLPIVIRLFGAGEDEARKMVAGRSNVHYVPRGTTLKEAARLAVELAARRRGGACA